MQNQTIIKNTVEKTWEDFSPATRIWIYAASRELSGEEVEKLNPVIASFAKNWVSHNLQLKATGFILENRFLILAVDESQAGASGCSIDKSVKFVRDIGDSLQVDFFNRLDFFYYEGEKLKNIHKDQLSTAYKNGEINDDTIFLDTLVQTKEDFESRWKTPLKNSWIKRFL